MCSRAWTSTRRSASWSAGSRLTAWISVSRIALSAVGPGVGMSRAWWHRRSPSRRNWANGRGPYAAAMGGPAVTRSRLAHDLRALGVRSGAVLMVHTRMSALGWVVGGSETVVRALLDALGPEGTLMAYASWAEHVYHAEDWPAEHRAAYIAEPPVF